MTTFTEGPHAGGFLVSEAPGTRSREIVTIRQGEVLPAGAVLGTEGGKYIGYDNDSSGPQAVGILWDAVDATDGDVEATAIVRDAEVNESELEWGDDNDTADISAGVADLLALGIIMR